LELFRSKPAPPCADCARLTARVAELEHTMRLLKLEQAEVSDRVLKWMRRVDAKERRDPSPVTGGGRTTEAVPVAPVNARVAALIARRQSRGLLHSTLDSNGGSVLREGVQETEEG
jgi:hypothetical protein